MCWFATLRKAFVKQWNQGKLFAEKETTVELDFSASFVRTDSVR